jgi:hypothetical protein
MPGWLFARGMARLPQPPSLDFSCLTDGKARTYVIFHCG